MRLFTLGFLSALFLFAAYSCHANRGAGFETYLVLDNQSSSNVQPYYFLKGETPRPLGGLILSGDEVTIRTPERIVGRHVHIIAFTGRGLPSVGVQEFYMKPGGTTEITFTDKPARRQIESIAHRTKEGTCLHGRT